ncbi:signal peptide peptidase SppA [Algivirga pacifica]|uniref:Signal peptide peptidase SppA n=1 Tax=Algivirga pacifica TaxID=1162670 RepID=A0ABP9DIC1_9BACT
MIDFIKGMLGSMFGVLAAVGILFIFGVSMIAVVGSADKGKAILQDNSILRLSLDVPISEVPNESPFENIAGVLQSDEKSPLTMKEILDAIDNAKEDEKIKAIYIDGGIFMGGKAMATEIRMALLSFKESGKKIYTYADMIAENAYLYISVSDEIYLNPAGIMEFDGLTANVVYYKDFLDKLGVEMQVFRVGKYKSAVEPFLDNEMSESNREQITSYLNGMYDFYLSSIAESRGMEVKMLEKASDHAKIRTPEDAVNYKLITKVGYRDEAIDKIKTDLGLSTDESIYLVNVKKYAAPEEGPEMNQGSHIAVLTCEGNIVDGKGMPGQIGGDKVAAQLKKLREDDNVKAVVLRINSPGGSGLASDIMWREIQLMKTKKPIIASMSNVAASGGYYMAMGCDKILAYPNTITGSIGVFSLIPNAKELLEDKLGMKTYTVSTGEFSMTPVLDALSPKEQEIVQQFVDNFYETFTAKAAAGRNMDQEKLKEYAQGRVWTGKQAKEIGLVDELGGIDKAVELAAESAGLEEYDIQYYPRKKSFAELLMQDVAEQYTRAQLKEKLGPFYQIYENAQLVGEMKGVQAIMPYQLNIQ